MRPSNANDFRMLTLSAQAGLHFLHMLDQQLPTKTYRAAFITRFALQRCRPHSPQRPMRPRGASSRPWYADRRGRSVRRASEPGEEIGVFGNVAAPHGKSWAPHAPHHSLRRLWQAVAHPERAPPSRPQPRSSPKVIVPRQNGLTRRPERPSVMYESTDMAVSFEVVGRERGGDHPMYQGTTIGARRRKRHAVRVKRRIEARTQCRHLVFAPSSMQ
jgi:hypothetical protein